MKYFEAYAILVARKLEIEAEIKHNMNSNMEVERLKKLYDQCQHWILAIEYMQTTGKKLRLIQNVFSESYKPHWQARPMENPLA